MDKASATAAAQDSIDDPLKEVRAEFTKLVDDSGGQETAAFQLGITKSAVSLICSGERDVGLSLAFRIKEIFGIPMERWVVSSPPETVKRFAK